MKKEDYKDYVYIRIPKSEYKEIIENKRKITKSDLESWRFNYELKQSEKIAYAKRANKIKQARVVQKIFKTLENYFTGLFTETQELTPYRLSKLANVNYRTAKNFYKKHNLNTWIKEFKQKKDVALREFKIKELSDYFLY